jgi:hypothetical protein
LDRDPDGDTAECNDPGAKSQAQTLYDLGIKRAVEPFLAGICTTGTCDVTHGKFQ